MPKIEWRDDCKSISDVMERARGVVQRRRQMVPLRLITRVPPRPLKPAVPQSPRHAPFPPTAAPFVEKPENIEITFAAAGPYTRVRLIISATAEYFHVARTDLLASCRLHPQPYARQIAAYLARTLTEMTLPQIGHAVNRDHSTVLYAAREIASLLALEDDTTVTAVEAIRTFLLTGRKDFPDAPPKIRYRGWPRQEAQALVRMLGEGKSVDEIALTLKRTPGTTLNKIEKLKKAGAL